MAEACESKLQKYASPAQALRILSMPCLLAPLGAGTQGISPFLLLFVVLEKTMLNWRVNWWSLTVSWSHDIYIKHLLGHCQCKEPQRPQEQRIPEAQRRVTSPWMSQPACSPASRGWRPQQKLYLFTWEYVWLNAAGLTFECIRMEWQYREKSGTWTILKPSFPMVLLKEFCLKKPKHEFTKLWKEILIRRILEAFQLHVLSWEK